jgi:tellurite methyltransferase
MCYIGLRVREAKSRSGSFALRLDYQASATFISVTHSYGNILGTQREHGSGETSGRRLEVNLDQESARVAWDRRYREGSHSSLKPDPFLVEAYEEFVKSTFPNGGGALDLAGGVGRHALYLAERGWKVTLVDIAAEGIARARAEAEQRALRIEMQQADLTGRRLPESSFDLILNFVFPERMLFPQIEAALKPGGMLVFKTYLREQLKFGGGPTHPMHLLESNELLRAFGGMRILHYRETVKDKAVAELVARK